MILTRIRLINWHIFSDNIIDLKGNTLITGENGNGKSTLIDAIFYVLSGGDDRSFNSAANSDSERSLKSYILCKLGIEGKEFLREESDIVCHLALEFYNNQENKYYVLGTVIEIVDSARPKSKFYIVDNKNLDQIPFIDNNYEIALFSTLRKTFGNNFKELQQTLSGRRKDIANLFYLSSGIKYYDLLKKAIAFKPLNEDVSGFVNHFLLNESDINIDSLKTELKSYLEIKQTIDRESQKLESLDIFIEKAKKYLKNLVEQKYLETMSIEELVDILNKDITTLKENNHQIDEEKTTQQNRKTQIRENLIFAQTQLGDLRRNDKYRAIQSSKQRLDNFRKELFEISSRVDTFNGLLRNETALAKKLKMNFDFVADIKNDRYDLLCTHIRAYIASIKEKSEKIIVDISEAKGKIGLLEKKLSDVERELDEINKGKNNYDDNVKNLIELLKENIKGGRGEGIGIQPLCECIEIIDKEWTNAIEGYLNTQRFDLILNPKYFDRALNVYENNKNKLKIYEVGIVNSNGIFNNEVLENSLYTKIKINNPYADSICRAVLGRVIAVEKIEDLKNHRISITKTCMVYKNATAKSINPIRYSKPFIGKDSIIVRKQILSNDRKELINQRNDENVVLEGYEQVKNIIDLSKIHNEIPDVWANKKQITSSILEIETEIKEAEKNDDIAGILHEIEKCENKCAALIAEETAADKKIQESISLYEKNSALISEKNEQLVYKTKEYETKKLEINNKEDFFALKKELTQMKSSIREEIEKRINSNNAINSTVVKGMSDYSSSFNRNLSPTIDCIDDYIAEYNRIKNSDIVSLKAQAEKAYLNAQSSFNENFIQKIRDKLKNAKDELDAINKNLLKHPFGRDKEIYKFIIKDSADMEMRDYYRIIMSGKDIEKRDLFTDTLDEKDSSIMQELFDKIANDSDVSGAEKNLQKYLDYRCYRQYDIQINNSRNETSYFSKIKKEKSGGETQTPFYVIIGSCFDELIRKNQSNLGTCIIALDEAFNNMDEPRIITLMDFYKEMNIQLLIVVPTNRAYAVLPHVDTAVALRKIDNRVYETYMRNYGKI